MNGTQGPRYGIDAYEEWAQRENMLVHEGWALDLFAVDLRDWPRYGVKGALCHLKGRGDFCNMFVIELPPGGSTLPQRHLYEEIYYCLEGRGSTQLEFADGTKRSFEWGPRSLFAIPLNAKHRHFNASGTQRALLCTTTQLPLMMKIHHNEKFIFENDFEFDDRTGQEKYYAGDGDLHMIKPGNNIWETNFIPDLAEIELTEWADRGPGSTNIIFVLADGIMHAHISEIAPATYKKAHRHTSGRHVLTVTGEGYSLLWFPGDADFTRIDWKHGTVFPPANGQFHQHFVKGDQPSRYVATGFGGIRYPITEENYIASIGRPGQKQNASLSVKLGGDQVEYEDQDPRIHAMWLEEMRKSGVEPRLHIPVPT